MTPRRRRMVLVGLIVVGVGAAVTFALNAFQENLLYFYSTSDVVGGKAPTDRTIRIGGMVTQGSVRRAASKSASSLRTTQRMSPSATPACCLTCSARVRAW